MRFSRGRGFAVAVSAATVLLAGGPVSAGHTETTTPPAFVPPGVYGPARGFDEGNPTLPAGAEQGQWAANWLAEASAYCAALTDATYQIDCLAERIGYIAGQMDGSGNYRETKAELTAASRDLERLAQRYRDQSRPGRRFTSPPGARVGQQTSTRPIRPVTQGGQAAAVAEARAIIERTETVLLRSSQGNPAVAPQITRIAAAVGSNKVLLRSA